MTPMAVANSENAPIAQKSVPNQGATIAFQTLSFDLQKSDIVRQSRLAKERRVRQHRREDDRYHRHQKERQRLFRVGESPPAPPADHIRIVWFEDIAYRRGTSFFGAGDRAHETLYIPSHPESFVTNPVALAEVLASARSGKSYGAE